jgi:hypothetical protein
MFHDPDWQKLNELSDQMGTYTEYFIQSLGQLVALLP